MKSGNIRICSFKSSFGELILGDYNGMICLCDWKYRRMRKTIDGRIQKNLSSSFVENKSELLEDAISQLKSYFKGDIEKFDLPILPIGTDFQKRVWEALQQIPYGTTISYLELSRKIGNEKTIRAVASANGANALAIIIPCHRIIGSTGKLVGYAGGLPVKKRLLTLESALPMENQLSLFSHAGS